MSLCVNNVTMKVCVFVLLMGAVCGDKYYEDGLYKDGIQFVHECGSKSLTLCFKEKALKYLDGLPNNMYIGNGITIKQNDERLPRQHTPITLPKETTAREAIIDRILLERIVDYLTSHTFEFKLPQVSAQEGRKEGGSGGGYGGGGHGGGGKGGKKKGGKKGNMMMPMMIMMKMKAAALGAIALKMVGLLALKALMVAKVALTIATVVALKKFTEGKQQTTTYEVVAHPHTDDYSHHYDRSFSSRLL